MTPEREKSLRDALETIANHPHNSYDHPSNECSTGSNYGIGCADGHRCAAQIARDALLAVPALSETNEEKDHGAGLIHQPIPDVDGTEPRPNCDHPRVKPYIAHRCVDCGESNLL